MIQYFHGFLIITMQGMTLTHCFHCHLRWKAQKCSWGNTLIALAMETNWELTVGSDCHSNVILGLRLKLKLYHGGGPNFEYLMHNACAISCYHHCHPTTTIITTTTITTTICIAQGEICTFQSWSHQQLHCLQPEKDACHLQIEAGHFCIHNNLHILLLALTVLLCEWWGKSYKVVNTQEQVVLLWDRRQHLRKGQIVDRLSEQPRDRERP